MAKYRLLKKLNVETSLAPGDVFELHDSLDYIQTTEGKISIKFLLKERYIKRDDTITPELGKTYIWYQAPYTIEAICKARRNSKEYGQEFLLGDKWFDEELLSIYNVILG